MHEKHMKVLYLLRCEKRIRVIQFLVCCLLFNLLCNAKTWLRWRNDLRQPARMAQFPAPFYSPQIEMVGCPHTASLVSPSDGTPGSFHYARAFGVRSLDTKEPLEMDNILFIASCTKLLTSIAAMQCVERGLLTLDTDVAEILPELAAQGILTGFDEVTGEPIINKRRNQITLR